VNVNKKADEAFMKELEKADPERYRNLIRNMRQGAARNNQAGICGNTGCGSTLAHLRAGTRFCSESCKKRASRVLGNEKAA
jgi:hypothetical protein